MPGESGVVLILAKLRIIAFIVLLRTALFLSLEDQLSTCHSPHTRKLKVTIVLPSVLPLHGKSTIVNATQQTSTKQSLLKIETQFSSTPGHVELKSRVVQEGGTLHFKRGRNISEILHLVGWNISGNQLSVTGNYP